MQNKHQKYPFWGGSGWGQYLNYILIVAVLLIIALIMFFKDKPGTLKVDNKAFAIVDTSVITTIKFSHGKNLVQLDRVGGSWKVNLQFNAKPAAIKALKGLLMSIEINAPVSKSIKNSVLKSFEEGTVIVSVESFGKILKAYRIAENASLNVGSFMMLKDDSEPYMMRVPGYNGRISMLFPCDAQFWRDKSIFNYRPQDILSIEVDYPANPKASFAYQFLGMNNIEIKSLNQKTSVKISKDAARIYLSHFANISYETQVRSRSKEIFDSISRQKPYCEIRVKNAVNQVNMVRTYQIPVQKEKGKFDVTRMYAVHQNDTVPLIIKYIDFDPIMKEYSDFSVQ